MKSILFLMETIYSNIFRCNYLGKKKMFSILFLPFRNIDSILKIFRKKIILIADVFLNLRNPNNVAREMSKKYRFRGPFKK